MKKIILIILLFYSSWSRTEEISPWSNIYYQVEESYVYDITYEKLAISALKGIKKADKDLTVGDDNKRITLYYKGKVVKVVGKPEPDNVSAWGKLTDDVIEEAIAVSKKTEQRSFEIQAIMLTEMVKILDKDSKFYGNMDEALGIDIRNHRQFAARMENDALYIKIAAFNKQTKREIVEALSEYQDAKGLILDLRASPGGMLGEAIEVADLFLDEGIIASTRGKDKAKEVYYLADKEVLFGGKPMIILVDGNTASAAEVLTAALQEQARAKVIGTSTKGKGTIQALIDIYPEGGVLAVTSGFFMTPSGKELNKKGIVPDICTFGTVKYMSEDKKCPADERETSGIELDEAKKMLNLSE